MIGVTSDFHFKDSLGYADYIKDRRIPEKKEILNFIVREFKDCETIVFLGDQLNRKNNPSEVIKEFVEFIERFGNKRIIILAGNHEKSGDGKSAIDFLREIRGKDNWIICADSIIDLKIKNRTMQFVPYFTMAELGVSKSEEAVNKIMDEAMHESDILFIHHSISDTKLSHGQTTNIFDEIVFPKEKLESMYKLVVGGHIHKPQQNNRTLVVGGIFNNEVGEIQKSIWKIDEKDLSVVRIDLPGRGIYGIENPTIQQLSKIEKHNIVKATITDKKKKDQIDFLKEELRKFDAYILLEQYPHERKKLHFEDSVLEFNIEKLIETYAKEKKVDLNLLKRAWQLIN